MRVKAGQHSADGIFTQAVIRHGVDVFFIDKVHDFLHGRLIRALKKAGSADIAA